MTRVQRWLPAYLTAILCIAGTSAAFGQGYDIPLTIQGIDHRMPVSAASAALGGTTLIGRNDGTLMFANPAVLESLEDPVLTMGGLQQYSTSDQIQQYAPLKYYSNFSLLMEGLTAEIPNPDTALYPGFNPGDTVQRPFDNIGPNWDHNGNHGLPPQLSAAAPFTFGGMRFAAGAGVTTWADLNHFYQNNNVLSPSILSERPLPINRPRNDSFPVAARWSQYTRSREGSIRGYGIALQGSLAANVSLGISGLVLNGTSDDAETRISRGSMIFYTNYFRLDSAYGRTAMTGTSDYSGLAWTIAAVCRSRQLRVGLTVSPPATVTRDYTMRTVADTGGTPVVTTSGGTDKLRLPWRGSAGLSIAVRNNLTIGLEYEFRPYNSAVYTAPGGQESSPWLSSSAFHAGAEFVPVEWLALRAGLSEQPEVFEPEGNPLEGDAARSTVYSAGAGVSGGGFRFNVAYEYYLLKYQDIWGSAISFNTASSYRVLADVSYEIRGLW